MQNFSYDHLYRFTYDMLTKIGCPESDAKIATEVLLSADLRGVDSHGVARLSGYVRLWEKGRINATPNIKIVHETPSTAVVDGDGGLGLVVAPFAMQVAINIAKIAGTGWVSVKHSNHYGIAGYHAMMALDHDMIGISLTNASPLVSPTFSKERLLGTFKQKFFSIGGKFDILDKNERPAATLQGKWTGWDFKFSHENKQLAQVSKKWAGLGKEFFTSADNYVLQIEETVASDSPLRQLILAAVMCIDMVLKE